MIVLPNIILIFFCYFILDARITKIIDEMQVVVGRIIDEFSENVPYSKFNIPVVNDNLMIPTRENDYCKDLRYENNPHENVCLIYI